MSVTSETATKKCERVLNSSKAYNIEHDILTSENLIIDRLLGSRENLEHVYTELSESLNEQQLDVVLSLVVSCAAFWNPEKAVSYREERKELIETNKEIAKIARKLADLLEKRYELHNHSGFSSDTHYSIINVIKKASKNNYLFGSYLEEPLSHLTGRFDLKYWPSIEEVIEELGTDAAKAETHANDSLTEASTTSSRPSKIDFLRALFSAIHENSEREFGLIPRTFELSDKSFAEIMNCALQLEPDELVDAAYIKRERQRQRQSGQRKEYAYT